MAPPPITPSPHRFITSKPANATPKPSSSLRFQQQPAQPSSSQFASTPRFNFSSSQKPSTENATPATQYSSPLSRRPHLPSAFPVKPREDIEETSSNHEEDNHDLNSAEPSRSAPPTHPTTKRRRPNPPEPITVSSDPPSPSSPPSPPPLPSTERDEPTLAPHAYQISTPHTHPHPRFVLPTSAPSTNITAPSIPSRPPLILPPRSPSPPLSTSAFFSPHRRGQKYIAGGLASTVRDWIVETAQVAHNHAHAHARRGGQEVWETRFRVGEVGYGDGGMVLAMDREVGRRWVLFGKGEGEMGVGVGCLIGVREPSWDVEVEGEVWQVGVEWKVLDG